VSSHEDVASDPSLKNFHQVWDGIELFTSDSDSSEGDLARRIELIGAQRIILQSDSPSSDYSTGSSSEEEMAQRLRKMCSKSARKTAAVERARAAAAEEEEAARRLGEARGGSDTAPAADSAAANSAAAAAEEEEEDVPEPPPAPFNPRLLSRGSVKHASGKCHVCHYYNTKVGCTKGASCTFCHMHGLEPRQRICKAKRAKAKSQALALDQHFETREEFEQVVSELKAKGGYLEAVVSSKARQIRRSADAASSSQAP